ncbi:hypothetical protein ACTFIZ_006725 [Dictyostelium cf. discoideum]
MTTIELYSSATNASIKFYLKKYMGYAVPTLIGAWVYILYAVIDGIFIGRYLGQDGLGALNLILPILYIPYAFSIMFGVGGSTLMARLLGEKKASEANGAFNQSITFIFILGVMLSIAMYFGANTYLNLFNVSETIKNYAVGYLQVAAPFVVFSILTYMLELWLLVEGAARYGLYCYVLGIAVNILLDYIFIVKLEWAMQGAALATSMGMMASSIAMLAFYYTETKYFKPRNIA